MTFVLEDLAVPNVASQANEGEQRRDVLKRRFAESKTHNVVPEA